MTESSLERARRLATESPARLGDLVLIGKTLHRVERPSYVLPNSVLAFCGQKAIYQEPNQEKHEECSTCAATWKVKDELLKLQALASLK